MKNLPLDVVFYEAFEEEQKALQKLLPGTIRTSFTRETLQESGAASPPAPVICIRTQSQIPPDWGSSIQAILSRSTGYDHLQAYRKTTGFKGSLGYLPLYCATAVAEQALLMWLTLQRKLPRQIRQFRNFHRDGLTGRESFGKTLVVVGVGNIGHEVVRIGKGLGMKVLGVDVDPRHEDVVYSDWKKAAAQADVVVCAMNLTGENENYFNKETWSHCKPGAVFVNVSRGELSPLEDLLEQLEGGRLAGAALDVYPLEKVLGVALRTGDGAGYPGEEAFRKLQAMPNVLMTPHNAFNTEEALLRKAEQTVEQILQFTSSADFKWDVP